MTADDLAGWQDCFDDLAQMSMRLSNRLECDGRATDLALKTFGCIAGAYLSYLRSDRDHPVFLPSVGFLHMYGTPNPDTIYLSASVDGDGIYEISGYRGTVPDLSIMPFGVAKGGSMQTASAFDFSDLDVAEDGTFQVVVSAERPTDAPQWWQMAPETQSLMLRSVSDDWGAHVEPRLAIVRRDGNPGRPRTDPAELRRRLQSYAAVVERMVMSGPARLDQLRSTTPVNTLIGVDYFASGGLGDQWYQEGYFQLADDEVLLIEAQIDPDVRSWSLALTDSYFSTLDWANAQSSLNRGQSTVDADGVFRAVIGADDPGVANWLDTTGHRSGAIQCRWSGGDVAPAVTMTKLASADLGSMLDASTARVTPAERCAAIRARQVGVQLRSQW
jgi:hypothetical protein